MALDPGGGILTSSFGPHTHDVYSVQYVQEVSTTLRAPRTHRTEGRKRGSYVNRV